MHNEVVRKLCSLINTARCEGKYKLATPVSMPQDTCESSFGNYVDAGIDTSNRIEEEHPVAYVNTIERFALRRERQKGVAEILAVQVNRKFGELPGWAKVRIDEADEATLNRWAMQILDAARIEDVFV